MSRSALIAAVEPTREVWLDARTAAASVPCLTKDGTGISMKAWHVWKRRHGILARNNGSVLKRDLDRELNRRKPRRVMHPASLANLHKPRLAVAS